MDIFFDIAIGVAAWFVVAAMVLTAWIRRGLHIQNRQREVAELRESIHRYEVHRYEGGRH